MFCEIILNSFFAFYKIKPVTGPATKSSVHLPTSRVESPPPDRPGPTPGHDLRNDESAPSISLPVIESLPILDAVVPNVDDVAAGPSDHTSTQSTPLEFPIQDDDPDSIEPVAPSVVSIGVLFDVSSNSLTPFISLGDPAGGYIPQWFCSFTGNRRGFSEPTGSGESRAMQRVSSFGSPLPCARNWARRVYEQSANDVGGREGRRST